MVRRKSKLTNNLDTMIKATNHFNKENYIGLEFKLDDFDSIVKILDAKQLPSKYTDGPNKWNKRVMCLIEVSNKYETTTMWADWGNIRRNRVRNPMLLNAQGGYVGVGKYKQSTDNDVYSKWKHMLMRVNEEWRTPYNDVKVNQTWLKFQNFAEWTYNTEVSNYKPFFHLDKDIFQWCELHKEYGPDTCVYIPKRLNYYLSAINKRVSNTKNICVLFGKEYIYIPSYLCINGEKLPTLTACRSYLFKVITDTYFKYKYINEKIYNELYELNSKIHKITEEEMFKYSDPEIRRKIYDLVERTILKDIENENEVASETRVL